jgi:hypothetical protein
MGDKLSPEAVAQAPDVTPEEVTDLEALLNDLAMLSLIAYDRCRDEKARQSGVRVSTLDIEVAARRPKGNDRSTESGIAFDDPEPSAEAVDGATLLRELANIFTRYVYLAKGWGSLAGTVDALHVCV